ncbi:MAG: helix-turn-helix transcriptional regulator [Clostridia bacterium]|nr:helix-turn-helix transcriptional regulator [Clostridia bacterium]
MDEPINYESLLREHITRLRLRKNISEHRMSLELGKSGAYIRSITSGASLPSVRELFNIISYFGITPAEFFDEIELNASSRTQLYEKLAVLTDDELDKVETFIDWIKK